MLTVLLATTAALLGVHENAWAQTDVPLGWSLIPSGLSVGDEFRLIFVTSTTRNASSGGIADYNTHVRAAARVGHTDIQSYDSGFRVVGCTITTNAVENTSTTGTGVPIYWLNGNKVADTYTDFYDGSWDDETNPKNESGTAQAVLDSAMDSDIFTGCETAGTRDFTNYLGTILTSTAIPGNPDLAVVGELNDSGGNPLAGGTTKDTSGQGRFYALSDVFRIVTTTPGAPTSLTAGTVTPSKIPLTWTAPSFNGGANITSYTVERAPSNDGEPGTWATAGTSTTTAYTDSGLTADTPYFYRVYATNSEGNGNASNHRLVRTNALPVVTIAAVTTPIHEGNIRGFRPDPRRRHKRTDNGQPATRTNRRRSERGSNQRIRHRAELHRRVHDNAPPNTDRQRRP